MVRVLCGLIAGMVLALAAGAAEEQAHGLVFERWLRETFFGGYNPKGYTQKWDIPAEANKDHGEIPVNPKVAKYGMPVGMGDALRQFEINEPFLLIVGFWDQETPETKRFVNAQAARVEPETWRKLWGDITREDLDRMVAVVKDSALTIEEARKRVAAMKKTAPFNRTVIELNPKLDRSQRRLQCSLGFAAFFDVLAPAADRSRQEKPVVFGIPVPNRIESKPRK